MAETFQVGAVVQVKSGGPRMTVAEVTADGHVFCTWFAGTKQEHGTFPAGVLTKAGPAGPRIVTVRSRRGL